MQEHIIFFLYLNFFLFSTIGYGYLFSKLTDTKFCTLNIGYQGLLGFFFLSILSILSSFFLPHNYYFNTIIHFVGIIYFFRSLKKLIKINDLKKLFFLLFLIILAAYVFKNHDDFPYYHLTYSLYLTDTNFIVGTGNFSHGFRTFSSLFYYHSLLYMPLIKYFLFHIGPFYILLFVNYIFLDKLFFHLKNKEISFVYFFVLLSFIFINVVFYRIGEHGTDRSAQILLLLIFMLFIEIFYFEKNKDMIDNKIKLLLIFIFFASSMKVIYYLYLILIPIILFKINVLKNFINKNYIIIFFFLSLSLFLNLAVNYFNTGCFLYPAVKTCIINQDWSLNIEEVKRMALHYEWWSKAGGGPGYSSNVEQNVYVDNFNWVQDWIDRHFFNKVSDTLLGIFLICLITFFTFKFSSKKKNFNLTKKNYLVLYSLSFLFLFEWFLNHPAMRYGGYVLFAIPLFFLTSSILERYKFDKISFYKCSVFIIILTLVVFNFRNLKRIEKEARIYKYDLITSPYFYVEDIEYEKILEKNDLKIYSTKTGAMCWASKTPCTYNRNIGLKKFLWMNMVYRNDK